MIYDRWTHSQYSKLGVPFAEVGRKVKNKTANGHIETMKTS